MDGTMMVSVEIHAARPGRTGDLMCVARLIRHEDIAKVMWREIVRPNPSAESRT